MQLWILRHRADFDSPTYDVMLGAVVRAGDERDARRFAARVAGAEGMEAWMDPTKTTCKPLRDDGRPGVIMTETHDG